MMAIRSQTTVNHCVWLALLVNLLVFSAPSQCQVTQVNVTQSHYIKPVGLSNINNWNFGSRVAINQDGTVMAIAAPGIKNSMPNPSGSAQKVYLYRQVNENFQLQLLNGSTARDRFGYSMALSRQGDLFAASAPGIAEGAQGRVAFYSWTGSQYVAAAVVAITVGQADASSPLSDLMINIALAGNNAGFVVGVPRINISDVPQPTGCKIYYWANVGASWSNIDTPTNIFMGADTATSCNTVAILSGGLVGVTSDSGIHVYDGSTGTQFYQIDTQAPATSLVLGASSSVLGVASLSRFIVYTGHSPPVVTDNVTLGDFGVPQPAFFGGIASLGATSGAKGTLIAIGGLGHRSCDQGVHANDYLTGTGCSFSGAVYVYGSEGQGNLTFIAALKASNTGPTFDEEFSSIALSFRGQHLLVGARSEQSSSFGFDGNQTQSQAVSAAGAAYLFDIDFDLGSESPTATPSNSPTSIPTQNPTGVPSKSPTSVPTTFPTQIPTRSPSASPTTAPTTFPTQIPTRSPSASPTTAPTTFPTQIPTRSPSASPTTVPTTFPTQIPTRSPSASPTTVPTTFPPQMPTRSPSASPTTVPTAFPTPIPTGSPSGSPTSLIGTPTTSPTLAPSVSPTQNPTMAPTTTPAPTATPTKSPTSGPTLSPTETLPPVIVGTVVANGSFVVDADLDTSQGNVLIVGSVTFTPSSTLTTSAAAQPINVTGGVVLDGLLVVVLDTAPSDGSPVVVQLVNADQISGQFDSIDATVAPGLLRSCESLLYSPQQSGTSFSVSISLDTSNCEVTLTSGALAGIIVGAFVLAVLFVVGMVLVFFHRRENNTAKMAAELRGNELDNLRRQYH